MTRSRPRLTLIGTRVVIWFSLGIILSLIGLWLIGKSWDFPGGFCFVLGIQIFLWSIGIRLQIPGNVTEEWELTLDEIQSSTKASFSSTP